MILCSIRYTKVKNICQLYVVCVNVNSGFVSHLIPLSTSCIKLAGVFLCGD